MTPLNVLELVMVSAVLLSVTERAPAPSSLSVARVCAALVNAAVPLTRRLDVLASAPAVASVAPSAMTTLPAAASVPEAPTLIVPLLTLTAPPTDPVPFHDPPVALRLPVILPGLVKLIAPAENAAEPESVPDPASVPPVM